MIVKVARAKLFVSNGMDLDLWIDDLILRSGNRELQKGNRGFVDCSRGIRKLEIPTGRVDPSMGDIHVYGNPHYLMDPANAITAAGNIAAGLIEVDPAGRAQYQSQYQQFAAEIKRRLEGWRAQLAPFKGAELVTYHRNWVYFCSRFGLVEFATVEPKPGIAPSAGHVNNVIQAMKREKVKVVLSENFRSKRFPDLISRAADAKAVYVPVLVQGEPGIDSYFELFDSIVGRLAGALR
jgi:zinc/manganese transport system substrate-binding protein